MTETQAPYTASIIGGTFALKVRPTRCEVGEALWRDIDAVIASAERGERGITDAGRDKIRAALVAYFEHKRGVWGKQDEYPPCFACHEARKAAG